MSTSSNSALPLLLKGIFGFISFKEIQRGCANRGREIYWFAMQFKLIIFIINPWSDTPILQGTYTVTVNC